MEALEQDEGVYVVIGRYVDVLKEGLLVMKLIFRRACVSLWRGCGKLGISKGQTTVRCVYRILA